MDAKRIINNIATNLRKLRKSKNITQEELIKTIGEEKLSLRSYKTYESGTSSTIPLLEKIILLAEYYNVSLDYIILSKASTYDDSLSKKDCLKRLGRLIYSQTLIPEKDEDKNSAYYGKYIFKSYDPDTTLFLEKYSAVCLEHNNDFEYKGIVRFKHLADFDEIINGMADLDEDWSLSKERFNYLLMEMGINPLEFEKEHLAAINEKRLLEKNKHK